VLLYTFFHPGLRQPPPVTLFDQEAPWTAPSGNGHDQAGWGLPSGGDQAGEPPAASSPGPGHLRPRRPVP
jgi:hypothetical protein